MERMGQEEFDARMAAGEDPYAIVADDYRRRGYTFDPERRAWLSPDRKALLDLHGRLCGCDYPGRIGYCSHEEFAVLADPGDR